MRNTFLQSIDKIGQKLKIYITWRWSAYWIWIECFQRVLFDVNGVHSYTEHCTSLSGLGKHNSPIFVYGPDNKIPGTLFLLKPHGFFIISVDFVLINKFKSSSIWVALTCWLGGVHLLARINLLWSFWVVIAESSNNWRQTVSYYCIGSVIMQELHWSTRRVQSGHEEG